MPVLKTFKNGEWVPISGMSEHTHTKDDIIDLPSGSTTEPDWNAAEGEPGHVLNRTHWVDEDGTVHKLDPKFLPDSAATMDKVNEAIANAITGAIGGSY